MKHKDNPLAVPQDQNTTSPGFGKYRLSTRIRRNKDRLLQGVWVDEAVLPEAAAQRPDIDTITPTLT